MEDDRDNIVDGVHGDLHSSAAAMDAACDFILCLFVCVASVSRFFSSQAPAYGIFKTSTHTTG